MKKAFDQTVRDIKRGVNKKVLKVPSIEQKVLDATSNEPWGPHGTLLADIAQASRNYHEYQMIMSVIWKRVNDTGKNWRHVYKGLTVLEYLVANGSERIVDEIREHGYQISALAEFQYIDSSGKDQGSNVRKKSQGLVALVNDKERLQEVRQKAAANREKFRNTAGGGGMHRPGSYDDDRFEGRYGSRDEDRNGNGREREWGDDKYGKFGDSYGGRYSEDRYAYGRDGYRDDEYRGRSRSVDGDNGPRSRSSDRDRERAYEDDGQYSSRGSNARGDDQSQDGRPIERKFSEQNLGAPPSYEDVAGEGRSPARSERDGETAAAFARKPLSPPLSNNHQEPTASSQSPPPAAVAPPAAAVAPPAAAAAPPAAAAAPPAAAAAQSAPAAAEHDGFDAFDPRGSFSAAPAPVPPASGGAEMDLFGSLSDVFSSNALALVPSTATTPEVDASGNPNPGQTFAAASSAPDGYGQPFDDPFGDGPFRAAPSSDGFSAPPQSASPFTAQSTTPPPQPVGPTSEPDNNFGFGDNFDQNTDILADILPPSGPAPTLPTQTGFQTQPAQLPAQTGFNQTSHPSPQTGFAPQASQPFSQTGFPDQPNQTTFFQGGPPTSQLGFLPQGGQPMPQPGFQTQGGQPMPQPGFQSHGGQPPQPGFQSHGGQPPQPGFQSYGSQPPQPGFHSHGGQPMPQPGFQSQGGQPPQPGFQSQGGQPPQPGFQAQGGQSMPQPSFQAHGGQGGFPSQMGSGSGFPGSNGPPAQAASFYGGYPSSAPVTASSFYQHRQTQSQPALTDSTGALAIVPQEPAKDKFETKSTVWADTLNRGLVNLNISGSKTNPLSDIGIDFEAINRKEKRMEKPSSVPTTSNVSMGKAMGSGSGIGRAGAGALRPGPGPMAGGMGGPGACYGGVNQPVNMGQGFPMQPGSGGYPMGPAVPGSYNPMMGRGGGYGQQPPPYGGYR